MAKGIHRPPLQITEGRDVRSRWSGENRGSLSKPVKCSTYLGLTGKKTHRNCDSLQNKINYKFSKHLNYDWKGFVHWFCDFFF